MNFIFFIIFCACVFMCSLVGGKRFRITTLYALAIGGVVNANFFHAGNYPIYCFGLPFGIDSIIYTLFIFCVIVMYLKQGKGQAYLLAVSSIFAIFFSAIMQLIAEIMANGSSRAVWITFLNFSISGLASIVTVIVMLELLDKLKTKINQYWLLIIGIVLATIINTCIYYPLTLAMYGLPNDIWWMLLSSFIGKFIAVICSLLAFKLINIYDKRHN